jgi:hypothetical protein
MNEFKFKSVLKKVSPQFTLVRKLSKGGSDRQSADIVYP